MEKWGGIADSEEAKKAAEDDIKQMVAGLRKKALDRFGMNKKINFCETCLWFQSSGMKTLKQNGEVADFQHGYCKYNAPVKSEKAPDWPEVFSNEYCGQWEAKPSEEEEE